MRLVPTGKPAPGLHPPTETCEGTAQVTVKADQDNDIC